MKKKIPFLISAALICIALAAGCIYRFSPRFLARQQTRQALEVLTDAAYQSIFFSTYDISTFSEEDFALYRGVPTLKLDYRFQSASDIRAVLAKVYSSGNQITNVYIGLDPLTLLRSDRNDVLRIRKKLEKGLLSYTDSHPESTFEILLSFPSMDYWTSLEKRDRENAFLLYRQLAGLLCARSNVIVYYPGGQEWLINNPANYINDFAVNPPLSRQLLLLTFCDQLYRITETNAWEMFQQTDSLIKSSLAGSVNYPDLAQYDIVFLGDSIIGNYTGSTSIPRVVNILSGASAFNCGRGGTCAAEYAPGSICFPQMASQFVSGQAWEPESTFANGIREFLSADHGGKRLCFIVNYGLNDYFGGLPLENPEDKYDISTYAGAMRTGIQTLQKNYPDAMYIIMGPGAVTLFENGTERNSDQGGLLADYSALSAALCEELDIPYIDLYNGFPEENTDLTAVLADGCHYNEYGRFLLGRKIIFFIARSLP